MLRRLALLLALTCLLLLAQPALAAPRTAEVDPRVLADLAGGSARVIVRLRSSPAAPRQVTFKNLLQDPAVYRVAGLRIAASTAQAALLDELDRRGATYRAFWVVNAIALLASPELLAWLAGQPEVLSVESDRTFAASLEPPPSAADQATAAAGVEPNLTQVHAPDLWSLGIRGQGIVVASADTGVYWQHPALKNQYRGWDGSTAEHAASWHDAIHGQLSTTANPCGYDAPAPCDDYGHGTHTVGTMVGDDSAGHQIGIAPAAKWIACRNMDNGVGAPSTYIECLQFFIAPGGDPAQRPHVINNSYSCTYGEGCTSTTALHEAVQAVRAAGIFMSVSAGNSGPSCASITTPPALEAGVYTIAAVDEFNQPASFSSRGPAAGNTTSVVKPELAAPGVNIRSSTYTGSYGSMSGTSMAAPHAAGGVALLWSAYPQLRWNIPLTEFLLSTSATSLPVTETCGQVSAGAVPNNTTGWGLLNILAAHQKYPALKYTFFPLIQH